ncbi:NADP-dependent oxidoreductase domain-containing protein 1 [Xyrichtys novacula]|uniref:NADP-dependent oxidoreductase domain-containing protein 1 n=1 Tax=Xyrichtys novacula TaxID=13765 RepID=A0AAV1GJB0_XYRNO|nr:NADP-dependent oxidoreductase domain-containing protein 1 [Xyrichtys novacula]
MGDVTTGLDSLSFETELTEEERRYISLREKLVNSTSIHGHFPTMWDVTAGLYSLSFETELTEEERRYISLREKLVNSTSIHGHFPTMWDVTTGLYSLSFEAGLTEEERRYISLRSRAARLTFCGCAHAVFLCKLVRSLKDAINTHTATRGSAASEQGGDLCIGIVGMGNLGNQLLRFLLEKSDIKSNINIKICSRRPESTVKYTQAGVECFTSNSRLAAWADILFLCCLPSHLPKVCADISSHLSKQCLVYSFSSAVPATRLAQLLGHDFIIKPQYEFSTSDDVDVWLSCTHLKIALNDPVLKERSCPLRMSSGISLNWVCAVLYSLLNICSSANLGSSQTLCLINSVLQETDTHKVELKPQTVFCASCASSLLPEEPFPWISLTDAQTTDTPLQRFLSSSKPMQQCISETYKYLLLK